MPTKKSPAAKAPKKAKTSNEAAPKKKTAAKPEGKTAKAEEKKEPAAKKETAHRPAGISGLRIRLSAFDHRVLDEAAAKIIDTAERSGAVIHGPIPLPTQIRKFTVNKSTFVHKNARDQYEMRTHRRLIDLTETTFKTVESLQSLSLPSGVDIEIKMK
ncbi:MAG: small subunit ribosomal protein S10 [Candidatus Peregrinibacteria bacterium Gr01-1014_25]|nr:MAG: small subunit ribosomal protein S10 [Candidatus Peregrinibacteria bacterium Gr01-1014_25]